MFFPFKPTRLNFRYIIYLVSLAFGFWPAVSKAQFYQGSQMTFGKNRVQFNEFYWTYYRFKNFDTYFYKGGDELAAFVGKTGDAEIAEIEKILDFRTDGRLQFILFNKLSDLKQTNIGLETSELQTNSGGTTKIVGNKILIYFDGNHEHFREQIRGGVSQVLMEQLMYGGNIRERLQSSYLLNLPGWFTQGLASYIARGWTVDDDNKMRDLILSGKTKSFNKLAEANEQFAGHSLWHYIIQSYGEASVSNLVYMTRVNRNVGSGMMYVLGLPMKDISANWISYYQKIYLNADNGRNLPAGESIIKCPKKNKIYGQVRISPDGNQVVYTSNEIGKYKVYLYDMRKKKTKILARGGYKSLVNQTDNSYPVLLWNPTGRFVTAFSERKGKVWMDYYHVDKRKKEKNKFFYFEKVLDATYAENGQEILISGVQKGQSDIFVYNIRTHTSVQITKDFYDDLNPQFVNNGRFIVFSSNRRNDTLDVDKNALLLPGSNLDLYMYDYVNKSNLLKRITETSGVNEIQAVPIDSANFGYLSEKNGIYNLYASHLDSVISFIDTVVHYRYVFNSSFQTNYSRNIEQHDVNLRKTKYAQLMYYNGKNQVYITPLSPPVETSYEPSPTTFFKQMLESAVSKPVVKNNAVIRTNESPVVSDSGKIDINNYIFQSEFSKKNRNTGNTRLDRLKNKKSARIGSASANDTLPYLLPRKRNYDLAFSTDYFQAQLDKNITNSSYQNYTAGSPVYFNPDFLVGMIKTGISDLMNDYKISVGFRITLLDFNSNEYLLSYENLKKRLDKQITFYRNSNEVSAGPFALKIHTHELKYILKYPFNDLAALKGTIGARNDRIVTLATDTESLNKFNAYNYWGTVNLQYVFDNTITKDLNLYNGTRYKIFAEGFKQFDVKNKWIGIVGFDYRHYTKIHRQIIWASRLAASTSFGDSKLLYYLGSEDNAIVPFDNFDNTINIDKTQNYIFQTLASPMRGYLQNIRNGNSFVLLNNEVRFPIFVYLLNRPIRSDILRNFQVVTFADIGVAWTGLSPYSSENGFNKKEISQYPFTISLTKQVEPLVGGGGFGLRTRLFGYFIRADWAWGYEDYRIRSDIFYLGLGLDF